MQTKQVCSLCLHLKVDLRLINLMNADLLGELKCLDTNEENTCVRKHN